MCWGYYRGTWWKSHKLHLEIHSLYPASPHLLSCCRLIRDCEIAVSCLGYHDCTILLWNRIITFRAFVWTCVSILNIIMYIFGQFDDKLCKRVNILVWHFPICQRTVFWGVWNSTALLKCIVGSSHRLTQLPCHSDVKWWRPWQAGLQEHECQQSCQRSQRRRYLVSRNPPAEGAVCHSGCTIMSYWKPVQVTSLR